MRNIKLVISYDGTNYHGWQKQPSKKTIQGVLEETIEKILQEKVKLTGASRTDAKAHAMAQTANFKTKNKMSVKVIKKALNSLLPEDIAVIKAQDIKGSFHSRFDSSSRVYTYTIFNKKDRDIFSRNTAYFYPLPLNLPAMKAAVKFLTGKHDFSSFCNSAGEIKNKLRILKKINIIKNKKGCIIMTFEANSFIYGMIRNISGVLLDVGRGRLRPEDVKGILASKDRQSVKNSLPASGLCLMKVKY